MDASRDRSVPEADQVGRGTVCVCRLACLRSRKLDRAACCCQGTDSMTVDMLLALLSSVRPGGTGQWRARCPAHDDRNPSLTIRQTEDRVLVWCWAGCTAADICKAIGLTLAKLYII